MCRELNTYIETSLPWTTACCHSCRFLSAEWSLHGKWLLATVPGARFSPYSAAYQLQLQLPPQLGGAAVVVNTVECVDVLPLL